MKGIGVVFALLAIISILPIAHPEQGGEGGGSVTEIGDAPENLWDSEGIVDQWQTISPNNVSYFGVLAINDSVDVFALEISSENWTRIGFSIDPGDNITISIQRLNQTSWSIVHFANESTGEIELDQGIHAVRIEKLGSYGEEVGYRFSLTNLGTVEVDGGFVNLAWMFTPFYVIAGVFLILPFLVVLWWNRDKIGPFNRSKKLLDEHEQNSLLALRERFGDYSSSEDVLEKIRNSLAVLSEESWDSVTEELGPAEIKYFTKDLEICAWRFDGSGRSILIGIQTGDSEWNMAAIRIFSPLGDEASIESVEPELLFQNSEVFIGDLLEKSTTFLRIIMLERHAAVNLHISGLINGKPVAVSPTESMHHESE
tara:strand:+ start:1967 stop:3076 length:1110 start_codon:yes stop_codon:yes gene_type:complete